MTATRRLRLPPAPSLLLRGLALLALLLAFALAAARRDDDFAGYVKVGHLALEGADIYADAPPGINTWPPLFSLFAVPLAAAHDLWPYGTRLAWLLLVMGALLLVLRQCANLVYGRRLVLRPRDADAIGLGDVRILGPVLLLHAPVFGNIDHLQINTIVLALVLAALTWETQGRFVAAGATLGLAIALRVMPLVFLPYLAWQGRWRTVATTIGATLLLTLLPSAAYGAEQTIEYLGAWIEATGNSPTWTAGHPNQSLVAMWDRFIGHGVIPFSTTPAARIAFSHAASVAVVVWCTRGLVALAALATFRRLAPGAHRARLLEWSIVFLVGAVFGPVAWKHYLVVGLVPLVLLVAMGLDPQEPTRARRCAWATLAIVSLFWTLASRDVVGRTVARHLEMGSTYTLGTIALLAGLFILRGWVPKAGETGTMAASPTTS